VDPSARHQAITQARTYQSLGAAFLDTETTGIGPTAEIVEIALVGDQGQTLYESLVKPRSKIESDAARIHGISEELLTDAPSWDNVWTQIEPILAVWKVGIYNRDFDLRIMKQTSQRYWINWRLPDDQFFCVMKLYAQFAGVWDHRRNAYRWHSLEDAGRQCQIALPNVHRALDDALLTHALFEYMVHWIE
jgi:DNA polymerase III subunit epsilon